MIRVPCPTASCSPLIPLHPSFHSAFFHKPSKTLVQADLLFNLKAINEQHPGGLGLSGIASKHVFPGSSLHKKLIWGIGSADRQYVAPSLFPFPPLLHTTRLTPPQPSAPSPRPTPSSSRGTLTASSRATATSWILEARRRGGQRLRIMPICLRQGRSDTVEVAVWTDCLEMTTR